MPFGFQTMTTQGLQSLTEISSLRIIYKRRCTGTSGSFNAPSGMTNGSFPQVEILNGEQAPDITLTQGSNTITWESSGTGSSTDFWLNLVRI